MTTIKEKPTMHQNWEVTAADLERAFKCIESNDYEILFECNFVGAVQLGNIQVEFILQTYDDFIALDYELFRPTDKDVAESFTKVNKIPYCHFGGGTLFRNSDLPSEVDLESFKKLVLRDVVDYIRKNENIKVLLYVENPVDFS